jgi:nucleoside-diphosphate-sugar epimerase
MAFGAAPHLFCFGLGYTARRVASRLLREGWRLSGTCRDEGQRQELLARGIAAYLFDRDRPLADIASLLASVTDVLSSVPPDEAGDPVLACHGDALAGASGLRWVGYLSTTGVYGDTGGAVVDETAPLRPTTRRSERRVQAEAAWLALHREHQLPVHVFRLAGIYGPGRNVVQQVVAGDAKRIDRPGHLFSRAHVDDIVTVLRTSMARPDPGRIYNVCDDEPAAPSDVVAYACALLGRGAPPLIPFEQAAPQMSPMALSFWQDSRRVDNSRIKQLGVRLAYPSYREGLAAIIGELNSDAAGETR